MAAVKCFKILFHASIYLKAERSHTDDKAWGIKGVGHLILPSKGSDSTIGDLIR